MTRPSLCPECGRSLTSHTGSYCHHCGEPLATDQGFKRLVVIEGYMPNDKDNADTPIRGEG